MVMELVPTLSSQRHYGANSLEHRRARESNPFRIVVLPKEQRECTRLFSQEFDKNNKEEEKDKLRSSYQIGPRITSKDECSGAGAARGNQLHCALMRSREERREWDRKQLLGWGKPGQGEERKDPTSEWL